MIPFALFYSNASPAIGKEVTVMNGLMIKQEYSQSRNALSPFGCYDEFLKVKFKILKEEWLSQTMFYSDPEKIFENEAYQEVISFGRDMLCFIFEDLEQNDNLWFYALSEITKNNPVIQRHIGNIKEMKQDWINWGKENCLI